MRAWQILIFVTTFNHLSPFHAVSTDDIRKGSSLFVIIILVLLIQTFSHDMCFSNSVALYALTREIGFTENTSKCTEHVDGNHQGCLQSILMGDVI